MIRLQINPREVWGFYPKIRAVDQVLLDYVKTNGWKDIPAVPVFRIPILEGLERQHSYALIDGNKRRAVAEFRREPLLIAVYEPDEDIDFKRDGLAESRNLVSPQRWRIVMSAYLAERQGLKSMIDKELGFL